MSPTGPASYKNRNTFCKINLSEFDNLLYISMNQVLYVQIISFFLKLGRAVPLLYYLNTSKRRYHCLVLNG